MPKSTATAAAELKFTPLDFKAVAADGAFEGYASLFDKEDLGRDVVAPGAFRDTLAARGPTGVKMLFQHNPSEPIGVWDSLKEDLRGLYVCIGAGDRPRYTARSTTAPEPLDNSPARLKTPQIQASTADRLTR